MKISNTFKLSILAAAMLATPALMAAKGPSLKIYRDEQPTDTVYAERYYLIGVTDPDALATIDGRDCHVYRTGSFGAELKLKPGENVVPVAVRRGRDVTRRDVRLVYATDRTARRRTSAPVTSDLAQPINITTLEGAYLQHGNGSDRLGGSKMCFIPAGVELTADGATDNLYRVALGASDHAYVQKSLVEVGGTGGAVVNTGSISISNNDSTDRIVVSLPRRLAFYDRAEIDPSTILVTLYGATNNSNWLTQRSTPAMVDYVDLRRDGEDALTLVIRLKDRYSWGYSIDYQGNNLVIDVRHRPESLAIKDLVVGLDAGHGGENPGAKSPSGLTEKEVNLDIILKAAKILRGMGARVVLTRDGDTGPSMTERKRIWREGGVDIAISVHNNASGNPLVPMGTSAYYKHIANRDLARDLHESMLSLGLANFGLTGNFNFSLNMPTEYPNALVEVLFMSSLPEEELLADPDYRTRLAEKVVDGLLNYLKRVEASL